MSLIQINIHDVAFSFVSIILEGLPFLIFGAIISGIISAFLPSNYIIKILPKNRFLAVVIAGLAGIFLPVCECAVVPVVRRLIKKGLPVSYAFTYLLASPIVNFLVAASTFLAFRGQNPLFMASSRIGIGFAIAIGAGIILLNAKPRSILKEDMFNDEKEHDHGQSKKDKFSHAIRVSAGDFITVGSLFLVGAFIVSILNTGINRQLLSVVGEHNIFGTVSLMLLAFVLSLCSTSDAFLASTFSQFSVAAKLGFMSLGPILDIKLLFFYRSIFKKSFLIKFAIGAFISVLVLSISIGALIK